MFILINSSTVCCFKIYRQIIFYQKSNHLYDLICYSVMGIYFFIVILI